MLAIGALAYIVLTFKPNFVIFFVSKCFPCNNLNSLNAKCLHTSMLTQP